MPDDSAPAYESCTVSSPATQPAEPWDGDGGSMTSDNARVDIGAAKAESTGPALMGWAQLTFIAYSYMCAGPFGVESVVLAAGPLLSILGIVLIPFLYVVPSIIIAMEMSTMMPTPHGNIMWVARAFGPGIGFFNAVVSAIIGLIDVAVYPTLCSGYIKSVFFPDASYTEQYAFSAACLTIGMLMSLFSAKAVGYMQTILSFAVMAPFLVGFFVGLPHLDGHRLGRIEPLFAADGAYDWGTYISVLIWLYTGWNAMGSMAGEVESPRVLVVAFPSAVVLGMLSYLLPLIVALSYPNVGDDPWDEGYLPLVFNSILNHLGTFVGVAGALSNLCLTANCMMMYPRMLWGTAQLGWAPRFLTQMSPATKSPTYAVLVHYVIGMALISFDFSVLVRMEMVVAVSVSLLPTQAMLRWREPDTHRPFKYPKSLPATIALNILCSAGFVAVFILNLENWAITGLGIAVNVAIIIAYVVIKKAGGFPADTQLSLVAEEMEVIN